MNERLPIPSEREQLYLNNAREAADAAVEPLADELVAKTEDFLKDRDDFLDTLREADDPRPVPEALHYQLSKAMTQKDQEKVIDRYVADPRAVELEYLNRARADKLFDQIDKNPDEDE